MFFFLTRFSASFVFKSIMVSTRLDGFRSPAIIFFSPFAQIISHMSYGNLVDSYTELVAIIAVTTSHLSNRVSYDNYGSAEKIIFQR